MCGRLARTRKDKMLQNKCLLLFSNRQQVIKVYIRKNRLKENTYYQMQHYVYFKAANIFSNWYWELDRHHKKWNLSTPICLSCLFLLWWHIEKCVKCICEMHTLTQVWLWGSIRLQSGLQSSITPCGYAVFVSFLVRLCIEICRFLFLSPIGRFGDI